MKEKPCDTCIVLANCSHVCDDFLQWCVDTKKTTLNSHPHFRTALISSDQINWINKKIEKYAPATVGFLFPD